MDNLNDVMLLESPSQTKSCLDSDEGSSSRSSCTSSIGYSPLSSPSSNGSRKKSECWKYFKLDTSKKLVTCLICEESLKWCLSTTMMKTHLKSLHKMELENSNDKVTESPIKQLFLNQRPYTNDSSEYIKLQNALMQLIIRCGLPISIVDNPDFIQFVAKLNNKYKVPTRQIVVNDLMPGLWDKFLNKVKFLLSSAVYCSITTDAWTSKANQGYLGLTSHYVDPSWQLVSIQLALKHMPQSHTSLNLKLELEEVFKKFGIFEKIIGGTADTANNIKHAMKDLMSYMVYIPCFCHVINLIVRDVINEDSNVADLVTKSRKLVCLFKHSSQLKEALSRYQLNNQTKKSMLKQDVCTRWNSTYIMLTSIVQNYSGVKHVLTEFKSGEYIEHLLSWYQLDLIEKLVEILEPFIILTNTMSATRYPSSSLIIPSIYKMTDIYNSFKLKSNSPTISDLIDKLISSIQKRTGQYLSMIELNVASFLDPRFRSMNYIKDINKKKSTYLQVMSQLSIDRLQIKFTSKAKKDIDSPCPKKIKFSLLDDDVSSSCSNESTDLQDEINNYSNLTLKLDEHSDPLDFWKLYNTQYPILSCIAKKYFCLIASSVASECLFSKAGEVISSKRSSLSPKNAEKLVLLDQKFVFDL